MDTKDIAAQAASGVTKGVKSGMSHFFHEFLESLISAGIGAGGYALLKHQELKRAAQEAAKLQKEGKFQEANQVIEDAWERFGMKDEAAMIKALNRTVKFLRMKGKGEQIKNLLETSCRLSESNQTRLREALSKLGNNDDQTEFLIDFAHATTSEQEQMLNLSGIEKKPEQMVGHVLASEMNRVGNSLRDKSNANVERIKRERAERKQRNQERANATGSNPTGPTTTTRTLRTGRIFDI